MAEMKGNLSLLYKSSLYLSHCHSSHLKMSKYREKIQWFTDISTNVHPQFVLFGTTIISIYLSLSLSKTEFSQFEAVRSCCSQGTVHYVLFNSKLTFSFCYLLLSSVAQACNPFQYISLLIVHKIVYFEKSSACNSQEQNAFPPVGKREVLAHD